jgi:hypothetical protein
MMEAKKIALKEKMAKDKAQKAVIEAAKSVHGSQDDG